MRWNNGAKILAQQFGMLANGSVRVGEDNTFIRQILFQRTIDHFALKLSLNPREELAFRFRNAQPLERVFDFLRNLFPRFSLAACGLEIVVNVLEIERDVAAPFGHWLLEEDFEGL